MMGFGGLCHVWNEIVMREFDPDGRSDGLVE